MADRYEIEFTDDKPGVVETVITGGIAPIVDHAIRGEEKGWYCTITDRVTGLHCTYHGSTKASAQERAMRHLKDLIEGHEQEVAQQQRNEREQERQRQQMYRQPAQDGTKALYEFIGQIVGVVLVIAAAIWLLFAVALPLFIINLAAIALVAGIMEVNWRKYFFPVSILAAAYLIADYNKGWFTLSLGNNVSFLKGAIPVFYYFNIGAGLVASYFLVRNYLNSNTPPAEGGNEFSQRNLLIMGGLLVTAGAIFGIQHHYDAKKIKSEEIAGFSASPILSNSMSLSGSPFIGKWLGQSDIFIEITPGSNNFNVRLCFEDGCQDFIGTAQGNDQIMVTQNGVLQFYVKKNGTNCITGYLNHSYCKK